MVKEGIEKLKNVKKDKIDIFIEYILENILYHVESIYRIIHYLYKSAST